ncbi:hypothetical protein CCU68_28350 [Pseudomonas gingeri NCPPB 3146 = LMG 5327]|uniref:Phage protein n=2 Tax=Pseudomonas gingeri TaxID=117681 RepID=A0A7Y7XW40_9PSED|nr:hypothetical protein [Pseudomonas gingeri]NWC12458.1 hypothetical protein [Pseudomonas gingeri]PNQ89213.1 hypothetical protein CCU68_28350 [Pseudomonas gingeri NCPPB 3146 = LMG 5327]
MDDDPIPLNQLYAAMEEHIARAIPALAYVGTMPDRLELVATPAVVIELAEWEPGHDPGTGEVGLDVRFEARVIVAGEEVDALRMAAFAAAQLTVLLRMQTWGQAVEPAKFARAAQDWTRPELDGYAVWVVEWTQVIYLGEEEWPWPIESGGKPMVPGDDGNPVELEEPV